MNNSIEIQIMMWNWYNWILVTKTLSRQKGKLHCGTFRQGYMLSSLRVQGVNKVSWIIN